MLSSTLRKALEFYKDRVRHAAVQIMKTVLDDPRLNPDERAELILEIYSEHKQISDFLAARVEQAVVTRDLKHANK